MSLQEHELKIIDIVRRSMDEAQQRGRKEAMVALMPIMTWLSSKDASVEDIRKWVINLFEEESSRLGVDIQETINFYKEQS